MIYDTDSKKESQYRSINQLISPKKYDNYDSPILSKPEKKPAHGVQQNNIISRAPADDPSFPILSIEVGNHIDEDKSIWVVVKFIQKFDISDKYYSTGGSGDIVYYDFNHIILSDAFTPQDGFELKDNGNYELDVSTWGGVLQKIRYNKGVEPFRLEFQIFANTSIAPKISTDDKGRSVIIFKAVTKSIEAYQSAGDETSDKIIRVAWTFDDGPGYFEKEMQAVFGKALGTTWFIVRKRTSDAKGGLDPAAVKGLKALQDQGGEIGIHSFHATKDHVEWFPSSYDPNHYNSIEEAMKDLKEFKRLLNENSINVKFVRPPYGLVTELTHYAQWKKLKTSDAMALAYGIIAGDTFEALKSGKSTKSGKSFGGELPEGAESIFKKIDTDLGTLKSELKGMGLCLWGGYEDPYKTGYQDWNAETSGVPGRNDTTTYEVTCSGERPENYKKNQAGIFEKKVDDMIKKGEASRSMIVLAHVTTKEDVAAVEQDKKAMEAYAGAKKVRIEYHTLASLFERITKKS